MSGQGDGRALRHDDATRKHLDHLFEAMKSGLASVTAGGAISAPSAPCGRVFAEVVFDQRLETWIALHQRAFDYFDRVPSTLVPPQKPDNLKAAVIRTAFAVDGDCSLNRTFEPLPVVVLPSPDAEPPRFARRIHELITQRLEAIDEPH